MGVWAGQTFHIRKPGQDTPHLWIVLTDQDDSVPSRAVIVNITSMRSGADSTCVLRRGDHAFIRHESFVLYLDATIAPCDKLEEAVAAGIATRHDDLDDTLLQAIQDGLIASKFTPDRVKNYCDGRF